MKNPYLILLKKWFYFLIPALFIKSLSNHNLANCFFWITVFLPTELIFWAFISFHIYSFAYKLFPQDLEFMNFWSPKISKKELVSFPENISNILGYYAICIKCFAVSALTASQLGLIKESIGLIFWYELIRMIVSIFYNVIYQSGSIRTAICVSWIYFFLALQIFNMSILLGYKSIFSLLLFIMGFFEVVISLPCCLNISFSFWIYYDELIIFLNRRK